MILTILMFAFLLWLAYDIGKTSGQFKALDAIRKLEDQAARRKHLGNPAYNLALMDSKLVVLDLDPEKVWRDSRMYL